MDITFKDKVVLVTGASRGIGQSIATMFAGSGAEVIVHYNKNSLAAEGTLNQLEGKGHSKYQADMMEPQVLERMVNDIISHYGKIDILVNNAGIYEEEDILSLSYREFQDYFMRSMRINLTGAANLSFLVAKAMESNNGGKIINITSRGAFRGEPTAWPYGASKAGLNSLGQSMALSLAGKNIQVYTIAPGFVETDMTTHILEGPAGESIKKQSPLLRVAQPSEIARVVLMVAAEGTEYMTGCIIDVNGASYLRS